MSIKWTPRNHPPHEWPIGQPASWRDGFGCPTICCKGEGSQRAVPDPISKERPQRPEFMSSRPVQPSAGGDLS
ncbi:hypothetical protein PD653_5077 [Nocardioides sp. PD653]|nr:hypothetical protein PD653_5077 [Nocardioides sp. PD653]